MRPRWSVFKLVKRSAFSASARSFFLPSSVPSESLLAAIYLVKNRIELFFWYRIGIEHYRYVSNRSNPLLVWKTTNVGVSHRWCDVVFFHLEYADKFLISAPKVNWNDFERILIWTWTPQFVYDRDWMGIAHAQKLFNTHNHRCENQERMKIPSDRRHDFDRNWSVPSKHTKPQFIGRLQRRNKCFVASISISTKFKLSIRACDNWFAFIFVNMCLCLLLLHLLIFINWSVIIYQLIRFPFTLQTIFKLWFDTCSAFSIHV